MSDQVSVQFDNNGAFQNVTNWTTYNIQRDFFHAADGFYLTCEDDRADQLASEIQVGMRLKFYVNNCCIMVGYIDNIELSYERCGRGKVLMIEGRDICGILADAHLYPNLGNGGTTDYQFTPQTTLSQALNTILANGLTPIKNIVNEDGTPFSSSTAGSLTFATGFGVGVRSRGRTGRGIAKSFASNLARECKPEKCESYLRYASRLAKHAGCFIKCVPGSDDTLFVGPPTYDRTQPAPFYLDHGYSNTATNNTQHGRMRVSYKEQPSVIIGEATHGVSTFRKQTFKVACINELTGYNSGATTLDINNAIPNVGNAIGQLTTGVPSTNTAQVSTTTNVSRFYPAGGAAGPPETVNQTTITTVTVPPSGYYLLPPNYDLYESLSNTVIGVQSNFSRPFYYVDYNAQTPEELMIGVAELMADFQDRFFELEYKIDQHSNSGAVWATNLMCGVNDQAFAPGNKSISNTYWIQRVNFTKSRCGGTETCVVLKLPYTHMINLTP